MSGRRGNALGAAVGLLAIMATPLSASAVLGDKPREIVNRHGDPLRPYRGPIVKTLARAFFTEPLARYYLRPFKSDDSRMHGLKVFFDWGVRRHAKDEGGFVQASADNLGAVLWTRPGQAVDVRPIDFLDFARQIRPAHAIEDTRATLHMGRVIAHYGEVQKRAYPSDHAYIFAIGVEPKKQHEGRGQALLDEVLRKADNEGWLLALEAADPHNQAWYLKNGFRLSTTMLRSDPVWGAGPDVWFMLREPQVKTESP